jgi:hypothetical protein
MAKAPSGMRCPYGDFAPAVASKRLRLTKQDFGCIIIIRSSPDQHRTQIARSDFRDSSRDSAPVNLLGMLGRTHSVKEPR